MRISRENSICVRKFRGGHAVHVYSGGYCISGNIYKTAKATNTRTPDHDSVLIAFDVAQQLKSQYCFSKFCIHFKSSLKMCKRDDK